MKPTYLFIILLASLVVGQVAQSATVVFQPFANSTAANRVVRTTDTRYPGTSSVQYTVTNTASSTVLTFRGNNYGLTTGTKIGLRNATVAGQRAANLNRGTLPTSLGSQVGSTGAGASYLSFRLESGGTSVFDNLRVDFTARNVASTGTIWAGVSTNGYTAAVQPTITNSSATDRQLSFNLSGFNYDGSQPVEFRIYGITGNPTASVRAMTLTASSLTAIPEPCSLLLVAVGITMLMRSRR